MRVQRDSSQLGCWLCHMRPRVCKSIGLSDMYNWLDANLIMTFISDSSKTQGFATLTLVFFEKQSVSQ